MNNYGIPANCINYSSRNGRSGEIHANGSTLQIV